MMLSSLYMPTLRQGLAESRRFGTFTMLLDEVGLGAALDHPSFAVRLLAVPDQVFTRMRSGVLSHWRADRSRFSALLGRHIIRGSFSVANDLPARTSGRMARGSAPSLDSRLDLRQPLLAQWQLDTESTITLARMGESLAVATFGGPLEVRVRPGAVTVGDVELQLGASASRWYEVEHLIGSH
jgi:hypothetical protein